MKEAVVFVHGIWMTGLELLVLRRRVAACGYAVCQFHYPSLRRSPRQNAERLHAFLQGLDYEVIHLVAHSLGGIVVLHLFDAFPDQKPGRVVMLGTPVRGSVVAQRLARCALTRPLLGRAIEQGLLGDEPRWDSPRELGMIAGTRGIGIGEVLLLGRLPRPSDGTVSLAATETSGLSDRLEVPHSHFGMLFARDVARAVCNFLKTGRFRPD
jgi:pimeloyl-ACP methyl ester carboxylesterase